LLAIADLEAVPKIWRGNKRKMLPLRGLLLLRRVPVIDWLSKFPLVPQLPQDADNVPPQPEFPGVCLLSILRRRLWPITAKFRHFLLRARIDAGDFWKTSKE
jgi:hypothetical protein